MEMILSLPYIVKDEQRVDVFNNGTTKPSIWSEDRKITVELFATALRARYPEGSSDSSIRDMNGRIQRIFILALKKKSDGVDKIQLSLEQFRHVKKTFSDWNKCPVDYHIWLLEIEEHLNAVEAADKKAEEEKTAAAKTAAANGAEKHAPESIKT